MGKLELKNQGASLKKKYFLKFLPIKICFYYANKNQESLPKCSPISTYLQYIIDIRTLFLI